MWWTMALATATAGPVDEAMDALAEGREAAALRILRAAAADDEEGEIICLLGRVARDAGDPKGALEALRRVPKGAGCAGQAAFQEAEVLAELGRLEEAAALFERLGRVTVGPEGQEPTALRLESFAERLLAEEDPDRVEAHRDQAAHLLAQALGLRVPDELRWRLARRLAALDPQGAPRVAARDALGDAVTAHPDDPGDRVLLSALLAPGAAQELLAGLADSPEVLAARARAASRSDLLAGLVVAAPLLRAHPDHPLTAALRRELGEGLAAAGWLVEATELLEPLAEEGKIAWTLTSALAREGRPEAGERLAVLTAAHPTATFRAEADQLARDLRLEAVRAAARDGRYDPAAWRAVRAGAPDEAALVLEQAWAAWDRDPAGAAALLEEVVARWPDSSEAYAALRARAERTPDGLAWLRARAADGTDAARAVADELGQVQLAVRTEGRQSSRPHIDLFARNLGEVELRLHRIDPEGLVRAGLGPDALAGLDVGIIEPLSTWTVELPEAPPGHAVRLQVPVPTPGPGLYAVTAATRLTEARTRLLVSDAELVVRTVGRELVGLALRDGEPVPRARFVVHGPTRTQDARADATGLLRLPIDPGTTVVLADTPGGPAMVSLDAADPGAASEGPVVGLDLDRPVYLPGDTVRFRAVASRDGVPVRGTWRVELRGGDVVHQVLRPRSSDLGTVRGEVVLPLLAAGAVPAGSLEAGWQLVGIVPGTDEERILAWLPVVDPVEPGLGLDLELGEQGAVATVRDALGVPVAGHPVRWSGSDAVVRTDAGGRARLPAPPRGVPWAPEVRVPRTSLVASAERPTPGEALGLELLDDGASTRVRVRGPEGTRVGLWVAAESTKRGVEPIAAPTVPEIPGALSVARRDASPALVGVRRTTWREEVVLGSDGALVSLPDLAAGTWRVQVVDVGGVHTSGWVSLERGGPVSVRLAEAPRVGGRAQIEVDGSAALVTVEGNGLLHAAVVRGAPEVAEVARSWHGSPRVVATAVGGSSERATAVDAGLKVDLGVEADDGRWRLRVQVEDASGRPVPAEVVLRATDLALLEERGDPETTTLEAFLGSGWGSTGASAVAATLIDGGWAVPLAEELVAEARREDEAERAMLATEGRLGEGALSGILGADVPIGLAGLGTRGSGFGGGGGSFGASGYGAGASGYGEGGGSWGAGVRLRGVRTSGLWVVQDTDRDGVLALDIPAPSARATWRVEAVAIGEGTSGWDEQRVAPPAGPWLATAPLAPGWPGDRVRPVVAVVNDADAPLVGELRLGSETRPVAAGPREVVRLTGPALGAGESVDAVLGAASTTLGLPLPAGVRADADGLRIGGTVTELALREDPGAVDDPARAAIAARAALAVWPWLDAAGRARAEVRIRGGLGAIRERTAQLDAAGAAQALLLAAEADGVLDGVDGLARWLGERIGAEPESPAERVALAWARQVALGTSDPSTLGRLVRDRALLAAEDAALLARLLRRLGRSDEAGPVEGSGPQALLARGGRDASALPAPPPPGDPSLPDWARAVGARTARDQALSWPIAAPEGDDLQAQRAASSASEVAGILRASRTPGSLDGLPPALGVPDEPVTCGVEQPCRLRVGEGLALDAALPTGWQAPGALAGPVLGRGAVLRAVAPGEVHLRGLVGPDGGPAAPLVVEVVDGDRATGDAEPSPLGSAARLTLAQDLIAAGADAGPLLADRASLESWPEEVRDQAALVRFQAAGADPAARVAAFEDLRDQTPSWTLSLAEVADTATAYGAIGRAERSMEVWRAALSVTFIDDAALASALEPSLGGLASIQLLRELAARHPEVDVVREAAFALPDRLLALVDALPEEAVEAGVTPTDVRLMAAAWDRDFVALHPEDRLAPEAGLRLANTLYELGATARAAAWCDRLARRYPDAEVVDAVLLLHALAELRLARPAVAQPLLERISDRELPQPGGLGASPLRPDARYALGRLAEARDDLVGARSWYQRAGDAFPEIELALAVLSRRSLEVPPITRVRAGEAARLPIVAANVDAVHIRVFRVDLRTLFLRDGGVPAPADIRVEGLAPALTQVRPLRAGPFPREVSLDLPLPEVGAYLVRLEGDGVSAGALLVRSDLEVDAWDGDDARRLAVRLGGRPVGEAEIRALAADGVEAAHTDIRGVAVVAWGAPALAWHAGHVALTDDARPGAEAGRGGARPSEGDPLLRNLRDREGERRRANLDRYDYIGAEPAAGVEAAAL